jgi:hypothetical protein
VPRAGGVEVEVKIEVKEDAVEAENYAEVEVAEDGLETEELR